MCWFQRGRADDVIKSFGYRLSPAEVEAALSSHPRRGRGGGGRGAGPARVSPSSPRSTLLMGEPVPEVELAAHCAERLARYKCPWTSGVVGFVTAGA